MQRLMPPRYVKNNSDCRFKIIQPLDRDEMIIVIVLCNLGSELAWNSLYQMCRSSLILITKCLNNNVTL